MIRPNTINALKHPLILKVIPNYVRVVNNEADAKFIHLKRIKVNFNKKMSTKELWSIHKKALRKKPGSNKAKKKPFRLKN